VPSKEVVAGVLLSPTIGQQEPVDQRKEDVKDRIVTQKQSHFDILTPIFMVSLKRQKGSIWILNTTAQQFPTP
jgi:hypothetical protein